MAAGALNLVSFVHFGQHKNRINQINTLQQYDHDLYKMTLKVMTLILFRNGPQYLLNNCLSHVKNAT